MLDFYHSILGKNNMSDLLSIVVLASYADKKLGPEEIDMIDGIKTSLGVGSFSVVDLKKAQRSTILQDIAARHPNMRARKLLFIEATKAVMSDLTLASSEHSFLKDVAKTFELEKDLVESVVATAKKISALHREVKALFDSLESMVTKSQEVN